MTAADQTVQHDVSQALTPDTTPGCFCFFSKAVNCSFERTLVEVLPAHDAELEILQRIAHVARIDHGIGELISMLISSIANNERNSGFGEYEADAEQSDQEEKDASQTEVATSETMHCSHDLLEKSANEVSGSTSN